MELEYHFAKLVFVQEIEKQEYFENVPAPQPPEPAYEPTPNDPPWNSWAAAGVWVVSVLAILILPTLFLLPYLANSGVKLSDNAALRDFAMSDPTAVILQLASVIPAHLITLALCWLVVTRMRKYDLFTTLGFKMGGYRFWHLALILVGIFGCIFVIGSIFPEQDNDVIRMLRSSRYAVYLITVLATFTAPIVEEVVYRGVLYSAFQRSMGVITAIFVVTILFAGVHVLQYWGSPGTIILITILSLALTLVRATSKNLLPCIILHFVFNGMQSVIILQQSYAPVPPLTEKAALLARFF